MDFNKNFIKPKVEENSFKKPPIYPIVCFLKIQLDCHKTWLGPSRLETMEYFLDYDLVLCYPPIWYEGRLSGRDDFVQHGPKLIHQEFRCDFINHITQADRPKMVNRGGIRNLWDENNQRAIYLFW